MRLSELFRKAPVTEVKATAVDYVEWLLRYMLRGSRMELTLDTGRPLPGSERAAVEDPPPCIPDAQTVINRLKILSGVQPVKQAESVEGGFERPRKHCAVEVRTRFTERSEHSQCAIRLRIRPKNT